MTGLRTTLFAAVALVCFVANSLLTRGALGRGLLDAPAFTVIRLVTGAAALALLLRLRGTSPSQRGSWTAAAALAAYAIAFTLAYTRVDAGSGALLLFGAVQVTMISTGVFRGERPQARDWMGMALATAGLLWLTLPGASAPDLPGAISMIVAGASWGVYSILGRGSRDALSGTAGNFWRGAAIVAAALALLHDPRTVTGTGVMLATISGAVASGIGYTFWYLALPQLTAWRAALVQLPVPILTALAAVPLLGESLTSRLLVATALVCGGVALTLLPRGGRR
jgi:drug/metabolite transporter (DMT)-like permease